MQGSETYDPLSGQEDGDGQIVWSDTSRLYPKKKKIPLKVRNSNDRFPTTVEKVHMPTCRSYPVVRRGVKGSQPRDCNVKCLYPYRAASVSVAFILSVVSAVVSPPPSVLSVSAAVTGCASRCDRNEKHRQHRETLLSALPRYLPSLWRQRILDGPEMRGVIWCFSGVSDCVPMW